MQKDSKIYIAGHLGMVGSAIVRELKKEGYSNLILKSSKELDLTNQQAVVSFFEREKPEYVFLAAAKVGGIEANEFISNVSVHPNPVENDLNVSYSLLNASDVTVTVVDLTGKVVSTQTVSSQTEGAHKLNVNTASFANGLYTVTIESVDSVVSRKFVKK